MDIREQLIEHEGYKTTAYKDTLGHWTVGVGHNLSKPLSDRAIRVILDDDLNDAKQDLDKIFPDWPSLTWPRQNVLIDMMFNLGLPRYQTFVNFWAAMNEEDYERAADEMIASRWARQVGQRAYKLSNMMRGGE